MRARRPHPDRTDEVVRQGLAAVLEVAARRGPAVLEASLERMPPRQRATLPDEFVEQLRAEAQQRIPA